MQNNNDKRKESRLNYSKKLFIRVLSPLEGQHLTNESTSCTTEDVSTAGLSIQLENQAPMGSIVELWIPAKDGAGTIMLTGEVRWSEHLVERNSYLTGINIQDFATVDARDWELMIGELQEVN